ncbi:MAG: IPT/TIG domain-containing protein [Nitrospirae bacterium]|nr:IPT/TIG domain-containing protein [Nitrospirota bacterium]MBI3352679.1 IPT/TIG domain-containing protein [Nitrospirota bacterium]
MAQKRKIVHITFLIGLLTISVIFTISKLFSATPSLTIVSVGNEPRGGAYNPSTGKGVESNHNSNTITIINATNFTVTNVTVGSHPYGVAINNSTNKAYIANEQSDTVSVITLSNNTVSATISVGNNPRGIAVNATTDVGVVANSKADTISILNLANNSVTATVAVGTDPEGVVINPSNNSAYVTNYGSNTVSVINLVNNTVSATIPVGTGPLGIDINTTISRIMVANHFSNTVSVINPSTNAVSATINVGLAPFGVAINSSTGLAYVSNEYSDSVSVINMSTNAITATYAAGQNPEGIAVVPSLSLLFVVNDKGNQVYIINLANPPTTSPSPTGTDPEGVVVDPSTNTAITTNSKSNNLSVINLTTSTLITTIPVGKGPQDVALNPNTNKLVTANSRDNTATIIDYPTRTVLATVSVGNRPKSVAIDPGLNLAAVANELDGTLSLINLGSYSVTATISTGSHPTDIAINPTTHIAVVANKKTDLVTIINLQTQTTVTTLAVGKDPVSVSINPNTNSAVVANQKSNSVSIINLNTNTVTTTISGIVNPIGSDINPSTNIAVIISHEATTLTLIDLSTNTKSSTLSGAGPDPEDVAINPNTNIAVVTNETGLGVSLIQLPNSVPVLTTLSPNSTTAGGPGFTLTLNGSKFVTTSTLTFSNLTITPQFISTTQLSATIPASALTTAGSATVKVTNPAPGGGTSNSLIFTIIQALPSIGSITPSSATAGSSSFQMIITGSNFATTSTINFSGTTLTAVFVSTSQLNVTIPASSIVAAGIYPVKVVNPGGLNSNSVNFTVNNPGPTITGFTPTSGTVGTVVTITGSNFATVVSNDKVYFNGTPAIITSGNATQITTSVPLGTTTGPIFLTTPLGSTTSATSFTIQPRKDYQMIVNPGSASSVQGTSVSYIVSLQSIGAEAFSEPVGLSISNLPAGMTAVFSPTSISISQPSVLTLTSSASIPAGTLTLLVQGTAIVDGNILSHTASLSLTTLASGGTSLSGQILATRDGRPLGNVRLRLGTSTYYTDPAGNFLIQNPPIGTQVMLIDGDTANTATSAYPSALPVEFTVTSGQANTLPYPIYLHEISQNFIPINPAVDTIVTDVNVPDFQMRIPAGVNIIGWDGQVNTKVSVTPVPIDRLPIKLIPAGIYTRTVYMFSFGKPGGGLPSQPIPVTYPNDLHGNPGDRMNLWYYDESANPDPNSHQWKIYGQGTVTPDGRQIVPDPGVGMPKFCCGATFVSTLGSASNVGPNPSPQDGKQPKGDPVDPSTGNFTLTHTDLSLLGPIPILATRIQRSLGGLYYYGTFGINSSFSYDLFMVVQSQSLLLTYPDGEQYRFALQTDGTYINGNYPFLRGAVARINSDGTRSVRFKDGTTYTFGGSYGHLIEIQERNHNVVSIHLNTYGYADQITDNLGHYLLIQYNTGISCFCIDLNGNPVNFISSIADHSGRVVNYTYAANRLTTVTDPNGGTTQFTYDSGSRISTITDARGITYLTNVYDGNDRVIRQTQADGGIFQFSYDLTGSVVVQTHVTDPDGNTSVYRFNNMQYVSQSTDPLGQSTQINRAFGTNLLSSTTDPLGSVTSYTYDSNGNIGSLTDALGNVTQYSYEPVFNKPTQITDALGQVRTMGYDSNGNMTSVTDSMGNTTTMTYNSFGKLLTVTDALGQVTTYGYDADLNLTSITDPLGNKTQRFYDPLSRLTTIIDPRGMGTGFAYDPLNRVTQIIDSAAGKTQFTYDPNGNLLTVTDAKNQTTTYTYDNMDRLATRTDPLLRSESYLYDGNGNLTKFTDRKGQITTFGYDSRNRRNQSSYADGSVTNFSYDSVGNIQSITDTVSNTLTFGYDTLNRLIQETTSMGGSISYFYDVLGRRMSMTVDGQSPVGYSYDSNSRLVSVAQGTQTVSMAYDVLGRRTGLAYPNGTNTTYNYDPASRLTNILHQAGATTIENLTYNYDPAGNRVSFGRNGTQAPLPAPVQAAYDAANEQIQFNSGTANLSYDSNGNLISQSDANGTTNYTWDSRNRLIGVNGPSASASFVYDALGRRISKIINGVRKDYQYDGNDIIAEVGGGAVSANYLRSLKVDEPFIRQSSGNEFYHADALGSIMALTDASGVISTSYAYEPFGKTTPTGASSNPFQFTGRENDGTGLYYYRARYYSPSLQRFISEDPIGFRGGINKYSYVLNNPLRFYDPFGLDKKPPVYVQVCDLSGCGPPLPVQDPNLIQLPTNNPNELTFGASVCTGPICTDQTGQAYSVENGEQFGASLDIRYGPPAEGPLTEQGFPVRDEILLGGGYDSGGGINLHIGPGLGTPFPRTVPITH